MVRGLGGGGGWGGWVIYKDRENVLELIIPRRFPTILFLFIFPFLQL
jgi:hypothetical protein